MNPQLELYKKLIHFQGIGNSPTQIFVSLGNERILVASRLGELGPWQAVVNNELEGITDGVVEDLIQSSMAPAHETRQIIEKPVINALLEVIHPVIESIIGEAKVILRDLEAYPVVKIHTEERTRNIEALLTGRIQPLLRAPIMEYLPQEEETLKKINQLLERDYPRLFEITVSYVKVLLNLMKHYEGDKTARTALGEEKFKTFKENLITFRDKVTFRQVRQLRETPNTDRINIALFETKYEDIEQMITQING